MATSSFLPIFHNRFPGASCVAPAIEEKEKPKMAGFLFLSGLVILGYNICGTLFIGIQIISLQLENTNLPRVDETTCWNTC